MNISRKNEQKSNTERLNEAGPDNGFLITVTEAESNESDRAILH